MPPDAFGPFRILHQVGAGTLGPVFRAYDSDSARLVAVKVLRFDGPPERMHQFVAELEALVAVGLAHPAIVAPLATGTDGIVVYLVQEWVLADSLDVVIRDHGPASPADALRVAGQLAAALDAAAGAKVHHGALHPRDVLISPDDARLTGLGVAGAIEKAGVAAPRRRSYTAPERITGGAWDQRADVFSLAAMLHEMLWGRRLTLLGAGAAGLLPELPGCDVAALRAAFARALAAEPADRFETALEFAAALKEGFPVVKAINHQPPLAGRQLDAESLLPLDDTAPDAFGELELFATETIPCEAAETVPGDDVEVAPAMATTEFAATDVDVTTDPEVAESASSQPAQLRDIPLTHPPSSSFDRDQPERPSEPAWSRMWPVAVALAVGIALGFGGGYRLAGRREAPAAARPPSAPPWPPAPVAVVPPGHEWTESAVSEPRRNGGSASANRETARPKPKAGDATAKPRPASATPAAPRTLTGALSVDSRPVGANVFFDGKRVGTTPMYMPQVAAGDHAIRFERDGYRRWSSPVRIIGGEGNRVTASLEK